MKRRMSPIWAVVEMNSNAVGQTSVVRRSRTAVRLVVFERHHCRREGVGAALSSAMNFVMCCSSTGSGTEPMARMAS